MPQIGELVRGNIIGYNDRHEYIWVKCEECGKERWQPKRVQTPLCHHCAMSHRVWSNSPVWMGGRVHHCGYTLVRVKPSDFFFPMAAKNGYIPEHRLVMAKSLGRCLSTWELVHHKNGRKDDNRIDNLSLLMTGGHNGEIECPYCRKKFSLR